MNTTNSNTTNLGAHSVSSKFFAPSNNSNDQKESWYVGRGSFEYKFIDTNTLLKEGISVVAISYRLLQYAREVDPPVKAPLHDAARALQFVRSKAREWNRQFCC